MSLSGLQAGRETRDPTSNSVGVDIRFGGNSGRLGDSVARGDGWLERSVGGRGGVFKDHSRELRELRGGKCGDTLSYRFCGLGVWEGMGLG